MKKFALTTLVILGFAAAAFAVPDFEIKIVEKSAAACNDPSCE